MGFKRTFDAENVQDLNVEHGRQISYYNKLVKLDAGAPCRVSLEKTNVLDDDLSNIWGFNAENAFETNAPFSWITTGLCEEDAQSGETTRSSLSYESPETVTPVCPSEDVYWCQNSPRKSVPIGRDYQADIPQCVKEELGHAVENDEKQVAGKCIIPMPVYQTEVCKAGKGRKECICPDKGSIRCVQQHIMENREKLFEDIGYERCVNIGLCEMGEEVANRLTKDEEDLFHEIVYYNPVSLDRDFWKQLKSSFPTRTMKEIVSYYFNVFILRRRAVQNRSRSLDVDSDDDEWQVEYDNTMDGNGTPDEKTEKRLMGSEEDSCMSFESQCPVRNREETNVENYWRSCNDLVDDSYSFDSNDLILLDNCWAKNIDLLPTSNIIDEFFGKDTWEGTSGGK